MPPQLSTTSPEPSTASPETPLESTRAPQPKRAKFGRVLLFVSFGAVCALGGALLHEPEPEEPPQSETLIRGSSTLLIAISDLARLENTSFHMERVIDLQRNERRLFGLLPTTDSILLVAAADVVAGVDLSRMQDGDIVIEEPAHRVLLTLPAPEIFSARLDSARTYVRDRDTDLLAHRVQDLESQARAEAERSLREAALEAGILDRASDNARSTLESLLRSLGFTEVEIEFRSPPSE